MSFSDLKNKAVAAAKSQLHNRVTKASVAGALAAVAMWALATFAFPGGVIPLEIQTAVPVVAAYVAGVVVPHDPTVKKDVASSGSTN